MVRGTRVRMASPRALCAYLPIITLVQPMRNGIFGYSKRKHSGKIKERPFTDIKNLSNYISHFAIEVRISSFAATRLRTSTFSIDAAIANFPTFFLDSASNRLIAVSNHPVPTVIPVFCPILRSIISNTLRISPNHILNNLDRCIV